MEKERKKENKNNMKKKKGFEKKRGKHYLEKYKKKKGSNRMESKRLTLGYYIYNLSKYLNILRDGVMKMNKEVKK